MASVESGVKRVLNVDHQGVGRCNLAKSNQESNPNFAGISIMAAGVNRPESGRTDIHPAVIDVARRRYQTDLSDWPVQLLQPEMVDDQTIVVVFCDPQILPDYVKAQALDVFLTPLSDPFGDDIKDRLEISCTQINFANWILERMLTQRSSEIGTRRDERGWVIPRYLSGLEPRNIESEYSYDSFFTTVFFPRRRKER